ncbi:hypothetical protein PMAYCL1PPCAC_04293 [Pristionchus mayeri]|uniref:Piwi domain-containing protein n=1 Tax=Pristionchus mayeri TaxID=1317129 RepID=A0AAN5C247_9BILA|nr:hypothetical protein PMAYCL1PPCAC_04293 [Pristionchus mayeri]
MDRREVKSEPMDAEAYMDELNKQLEQVRLPKREDYPEEEKHEDGFGRSTWVYLNVFNLQLDKAPPIIYKYDLVFIYTRTRGEEYTLHNALTHANDVARSAKRAALSALCRMMHKTSARQFKPQAIGTHYWRDCCAFDCGSTYYTAVDLPNMNGEIPEEEWKDNDNITAYARSGKGPIRWSLTLVETIPIDGENAKSQSALQFFDVLTTQKMIRSEDIDFKPDAAYLVDGEITNDQKELRKGIVTASRVIGDNICIQMDSKISLFFQEILLLDYIKKYSKKFSEGDLERYLKDRMGSRKLRDELRNLPLRIRHLKARKTFECKGFHNQNALECTFTKTDENGEEFVISVADHFERTHKYRLKYPRLPLVVERKGPEKNSYHPIECLDIVGGIRVSNQKMSREAQDSMIKRACREPRILGQDMDMSRKVAGLDGTNKYMKPFNIQPSTAFAAIQGKVLAKPQLSGMAGQPVDIVDRGNISYTKGNFRFADPAKPSKPITLVTLDSALRESDISQIKEELRRFGGDFGMQIEFANIRDPGLFGGEVERLREFMGKEKSKTSMFFFITREKMDESHNMVKKLEQELGVVTQCLSLQTSQQILSRKRVTEFNVVAKMNQKLGGTIANPEVPPELRSQNPDAFARAQRDWFKDRMFVGLTLSHAGAQSFADRVMGTEVREPTCVGMAFTLKHAGKRTAMSWFQQKRRAIIEDITRHFVRALDIYAESNGGKMPIAIMIWRKGMSEGELKMAVLEMKQVVKAIAIIGKRPGMENYRPTLQCVVCQSNTADRLFYQMNGDTNVPAGTCLEDKATNPDRVEFLIVPHNAIKGTAKAVRCTLVHDQKGTSGRRLQYSEIQSVYHSLCYINGVAASPTRLPVPLADSEKAAVRQMNIFKESMRSGDDSMSMSSGRSGTGLIHDGSEDFFVRLSDQFAHKFRDLQYYA